MEIEEEKTLYAQLFIKHAEDAFKAGLELHPNNVNRALQIACEFPKDNYVKELILKYKNEGKDLDYLPGKGQLAKAIWDKMQNTRINADDFTKLAKLYAEVRGFIDRNPSPVTLNNIALSEDEINAKITRLIKDA